MQETVNYLTACNQLFERGILGKKVYIKSVDSNPIISSMDQGFKFFSEWLDVELSKGEYDSIVTLCIVFITSSTGYSITETKERSFLSWQTWDLLRVMYYGFRGFCHDFLSQHPGYTIFPIRLNGSAIESFFSKIKHTTSGHLSSTNYASARAALLTRGTIGDKKHKDDYRSAPLHERAHPLRQKKYKSRKGKKK